MRLRIGSIVQILWDEMNQISSEGADYESNPPTMPLFDHHLRPTGEIVSYSEAYRKWLAEWQSWGQPLGKREWLETQRINVKLEQ